MITFANSFDPDKARQNFGPDLGPNLFYTLMVFLKVVFEKVDFEKKSADDKKHFIVAASECSGKVLITS